MSDTIYQYRVYCIEESTYVTVYGTTEPTICPNDHADRTIDTNLTSAISEYIENVTLIEENTQGDFETAHVKMNIPTGTPGDVTEHDVVWPMDILLWLSYLKPVSEMIGDEITVLAAPETQIGAVVSTVNIGDTVFTVNPGLFDYIKRGYAITLDDGVNKEMLGRCTAHDSVASTITVETATTFSYAPGTPVKISIYVIDGLEIIDTEIITIGGKGMKGKTVTAGTILRVYYTNNSGTAKVFRWRPEYYNNG